MTKAAGVLVIVMALAGSANAGPPSKARVEKDVRKPTMLSLTVEAAGEQQGNASEGVVEYVVPVRFREKSVDFPPYIQIVLAHAIYNVYTNGTHTFKRLDAVERTFEGVPPPTLAEITSAIVGAPNPQAVLGAEVAGKMIGAPEVAFAASPNWQFRTPNNLEVELSITYARRSGKTSGERVRQPYRMLFHRNDAKAPWVAGPGERPESMKPEIVGTIELEPTPMTPTERIAALRKANGAKRLAPGLDIQAATKKLNDIHARERAGTITGKQADAEFAQLVVAEPAP